MIFQEKIHRKARSDKLEERQVALELLRNNFVHLPNKKQAWEDIISFTQDKHDNIRLRAADAIVSTFSEVPDKNQVWIDLHRLILDKDDYVRWCAVETLGLAYPHVPDKNQAWVDLIQLAQDNHNDVRWRAVKALSSAYPHVPDKNLAWKDIHHLTRDDDEYVRRRATQAIGSIFSHIPDKNQAWADLHYRISDRDNWVRGRAAEALGSAYPNIPDKNQAWADLIHLVQDKHEYVRLYASQSLSSVYPYVPNKNFAWKDLHNLTRSVEDGVRKHLAVILGSAYLYIPNKNQAWADLHSLSMDKNTSVRRNAANAIGSGYPHILDKSQAWEDLQRLTEDKNINVRIYAYYSIGRASIFKASEATSLEEFKKEMENALKYFDRSSKEDSYLNPAGFCNAFYRSFYVIAFKPQESEVMVQKYLAEAKKKVAESENKEKLLEIMENLSDALKEVYKLREKGLEAWKSDPKAYKQYCDRAYNLLDKTEKDAPGATKIIRMGFPIIDQQIQEMIADIQEKAEVLCKQTIDTPFEGLGKEINQIGQDISEIKDPTALKKSLDNLQIGLSAICHKMPEGDIAETYELVKKANDEPCIEDRINLINVILGKISSQMSKEKIDRISKTYKLTANQISITDINDSEIRKQNSGIKNVTNARLSDNPSTSPQTRPSVHEFQNFSEKIRFIHQKTHISPLFTSIFPNLPHFSTRF